MKSNMLIVRDGLRAAEQLFEKVFRQQYPAESEITWERNGLHRGRVLMHGSGCRAQVRNSKTGATLWIDAGDVCRALEKEPV